MTQLEYVLDSFEQKLAAWRGKRILLHGTWIYAQGLLERFDKDWRFLGVVTEDTSFRQFCGKPVFPESRLEELDPDVIILTDSIGDAESAYQRLRALCLRRGIALWDMFGLDWLDLREEIDRMRYNTLEEWLAITAPYDAVSFEEIDCFMQQQPGPKGIQLRPRNEMRVLATKLRAKGKTLLFMGRGGTSPETQIHALVDNNVISDPAEAERCFFSREGEDADWLTVRQRFPGRILHIGYGIDWECVMPRQFGVDTYRMLYGPPGSALTEEVSDVLPTPGELAAQLDEALASCRIISFDVFDTLLQHTVLEPEDVFALTEARAAREGSPVNGFAAERRAAQTDDNADIHEIYRRIASRCGLSDGQRDRLMALELDVERQVLTRRESVCAYYRRAVEAGARVVLTSDMYLPAPMLAELLASQGISGYEKLIVSCDLKLRKQQGLLQEVLALRRPGEKAAHIGNDYHHDVLPALTLGMCAVRVPSARELAREAGYGGAWPFARTLEERCLLGLSVSRAFSDPFELGRLPGLPPQRQLERYADLAAGPMLAGYLTWLMDEARRDRPDGVLFAARDGWLLREIYDELAASHPEWGLPPSVYFLTSRHAAFLPVSDDLTYVYNVQGMAESGNNAALSMAERLRVYYGLEPEKIHPPETDETDIRSWVIRNIEPVCRRAEEARKGSLRYFERLGLLPGERYFFVDFVAAGSAQSFIERIAPFRLEGKYFAQREQLTVYPPTIETYLPENTPFLKRFMEMESILTSPDPSLDSYSPEGEPVFATELRSEEMLEQTRRIHAALRAYLRAFFELLPFRPDVIRAELPEIMYGAEPDHAFYRENYDDWGKCEFKF